MKAITDAAHLIYNELKCYAIRSSAGIRVKTENRINTNMRNAMQYC